MSEEHVSHVFDAFAQADETMSRRFGGTGLGLTISSGLAHLLGGDIKVESELGHGSKFTLSIPVGRVEHARLVHCPHEAMGIRSNVTSTVDDDPKVSPLSKASLSEGRVLLVEDGLDNQRLIRFFLTKAGVEVTIAENGKVGLELAVEAWQREDPYEIVFMDMQMPVMDGYTATSRLRELGYPFPIVALTAHAMSHDRKKCLDAGCDDFVSKPVDRKHLISTAVRWQQTFQTVAGKASPSETITVGNPIAENRSACTC